MHRMQRELCMLLTNRYSKSSVKESDEKIFLNSFAVTPNGVALRVLDVDQVFKLIISLRHTIGINY